MWKFALLLALAHGAFCIAPGSYWVLETLKCSEHRVILEPNKNLIETPEAFNQMCEQQDEFYLCLENMVSLQGLSTVAELPSEIKHERSIFKGLCSKDSKWRKRYLEFAPCINMQQTDFCSTPEFLRADGGDQSPSILKEKTANCIAATLTMKCSIEAGRLFHYLKKLANDDNCQSEQITCYDAESRPNGNKSKASVFDEIYDQLVKKIGHILDQDNTDSLVLHKRVGDSPRDLRDFEDEITTDSSDVEGYSVLDSHVENADYPENVENTAEEEYASEPTSASDDLDELAPILHHPFYPDLSGPEFGLDKPYWDPVELYETVRVFPDGRINHYTRHRGFTVLKSVECGHFPGYFRCANVRRDKDPECLEPTNYTGPTTGEFFPEEFDPDFGAKLYKTVPFRNYIFERWLDQSTEVSTDPLTHSSVSASTQPNYMEVDSQNVHDMRDGYAATPNIEQESTVENVSTERNWDTTGSGNIARESIEHISTEPNWDIKGSGDAVEQLEDSDTHIYESDSTSDINQNRVAFESPTEETPRQMFDVFTTVMPTISGILKREKLPSEIVQAYEDLYTLKSGPLRNVRYSYDLFGNLYWYWTNQKNSIIDTITCGRVNECHPRAEGIWKCVIVPRKVNEK